MHTNHFGSFYELYKNLNVNQSSGDQFSWVQWNLIYGVLNNL